MPAIMTPVLGVEIASPAHDVSIRAKADVGRYLGSHPRANVSMMRIAEPQHGHGVGSTFASLPVTVSAGALSGLTEVTMPSNARAAAMASARLPLARRP